MDRIWGFESFLAFPEGQALNPIERLSGSLYGPLRAPESLGRFRPMTGAWHTVRIGIRARSPARLESPPTRAEPPARYDVPLGPGLGSPGRSQDHDAACTTAFKAPQLNVLSLPHPHFGVILVTTSQQPSTDSYRKTSPINLAHNHTHRKPLARLHPRLLHLHSFFVILEY